MKKHGSLGISRYQRISMHERHVAAPKESENSIAASGKQNHGGIAREEGSVASGNGVAAMAFSESPEKSSIMARASACMA